MLFREAKLVDEESLEYALSDETVDRYGDVIMADGWVMSAFKRNPIALFNHDPFSIIGSWEKVRVEAGRLLGRLRLADAGTSPLVDYVRALVAQRHLKAVSVGFRPLKEEPLDEDSDPFWGPFRYLKQELVESSLVAVPANPNALQIGKALNLSANDEAVILGKLAKVDDREKRRRPTASSPNPLPTGRTSMKLSERIKAAQTDLNRLRDTLTALVEKDDPTDEDEATIEELNTSIPDAVKALERMQATERALAVQIIQHDPNEPDPNNVQRNLPAVQRPFAVPAKKVTPVDMLVRSMTVYFRHFIRQEPIELARKTLYGDDETTTWFVRAVTNPALTTVPGWAQELVQIAVAEFMDTLQPFSVFPTIRDKGTTFTFNREGGMIKFPGRTPTPKVSGAWVGEGMPIPVRRLGVTSISLLPKKLAVISDFSQEMADYSTPSIEQVIRQAMAEDTAVVIDTNLIDAGAADTIRPPGLRNGVAITPASANTDPTQAMIEDLKALVGAIIGANGGRDIVIILNSLQAMGINFAQTPNGFLFPSEDEAGRRFNVTFVSSTTVTPGLVIAVDAADFSSASGAAPEYNVSNQATVHEEDTAPLPIVSNIAGIPPIAAATASPTRSYWQTDTIGIRMRLPLNWSMRRAGMVAWTEGVLW